MYVVTSYHLPGVLIGFTELGDINTHLEAFEHKIEEDHSDEVLADSMLVLKVRGLFSQLKFPYAQFPCTTLSGHQMFEVFWDAVCQLERCGFKVFFFSSLINFMQAMRWTN